MDYSSEPTLRTGLNRHPPRFGLSDRSLAERDLRRLQRNKKSRPAIAAPQIRTILAAGAITLSYQRRFAIIAASTRTRPRKASRSKRLLIRMQGGCTTAKTRIGIGHDTHRLAEGGPLRLGGVDIPHDRHLQGHSDADVLLHAVTDAILGAVAFGDIGELFPDTDEANRNRDSAEMLRVAWHQVGDAGYSIVNLDCIVFAQQPKLSPHRTTIRQRIAEILTTSPEQIGLKAKTGEGVGVVGNEVAIAAQCVALLEQTR